MTWVNRGLSAMLDAALSPFQTWPPVTGLAGVAALVAVAMLLVAKAVSNQRAIIDVKRRIQAGLFEVRLFNDDIRALHSLGDVLRHNFTYLRLSLAPLPWLIVPLTLLVAHLQFYYGYEGFLPGQSAVVKVRLHASAVPGNGAFPGLMLVTPPGVSLQTPPVWIPSAREAAWRIRLEQYGDYTLVVAHDGWRVTKTVRVSNRPGQRSPVRYAAAFLNELLYPAEPAIAAGVPVEAVQINYAPASIDLFGFDIGWMPLFFGLSLLFAWLMRRRFSVEL
jgi:hypothetical protein